MKIFKYIIVFLGFGLIITGIILKFNTNIKEHYICTGSTSNIDYLKIENLYEFNYKDSKVSDFQKKFRVTYKKIDDYNENFYSTFFKDEDLYDEQLEDKENMTRTFIWNNSMIEQDNKDLKSYLDKIESMGYKCVKD